MRPTDGGMIPGMTRCESMSPVVAAVFSACCVVTSVASPGLPAPALPADEAGDPSSKEGAAAESAALNPEVEAAGQRLIDEYRQQGEHFAEALMLAAGTPRLLQPVVRAAGGAPG